MSTDPQEPGSRAQDPRPNEVPSGDQSAAAAHGQNGQNERTETILPTPPPATYAATPPPAQRSRTRRSGLVAGLAIALAVLVGAGGGIAIYAASTSHGHGNPRQSVLENRNRPEGMPNSMPGRNMPGMPNRLGLGQALHGDFVVPGDQGNYVTRRQQNGNVTEISATSITVASKDGYTQTYAINDSTRKNQEPKTGDTVTVVATVTGNTATANIISEGNSAPRGNPRPRN